MMEFKLTPVSKIPEFIPYSCGYHSQNHTHLPILWRNSKYIWMGRCYFYNRYAEINLIGIYVMCSNYEDFIFELVDSFYHEFLHIYFNSRWGKWGHAEKKIMGCSMHLTICELEDPENSFWYEYFNDLRDFYNGAI